MKFLKSSLITLALISSSSVWAKNSSGSNFSMTPIIGLERIQRFQPTPTMKTRTIIGLETLYKLPVAAIEAGVTYGEDSSYDSSITTNYKDADTKLKLGLRGAINEGAVFSSYLRGGAQLKQNKQSVTVTGSTTTTSNETKINPYLGSGLSIKLLNNISISADITAVYTPTSVPGLSDYEVQPSLGFILSI